MTGWDDGVGAVVFTALDLEYDAVRGFLTDLRVREHPTGTLFEVGTVRGTSTRVAMVVSGVGGGRAAVLVERAIAAFRPGVVLVVGVAGALRPGIEIGDVVVGTRVYGYQGGKETAAGFVARPRAWDAPHHLEQWARHLARTGGYRRLISGECPFRLHFGPVAAGEVVFDSRTGAVADLLRQHYDDVLAVEMESAGVAEAAHLNRSVPTLTIRGISDRADGAKAYVEAAGSQVVAAAHAAVFALAVAVAVPGESANGYGADPAKYASGRRAIRGLWTVRPRRAS